MALTKTLFLSAGIVMLAGAQTHSYTQGDIEEGVRMYRTMCIGCHGSDGALVSGIDLSRGKFRKVKSDEEIMQVIVNGSPGTGMPASAISPPRAYTIVAFIRNMADPPGRKSIAAKSGMASRGKALFASQGCNGCHRVRGEGGRSGPDLSEAGLTLRPIEIETAMLEPGYEDFLHWRALRVVPKNGAAVTGLLLNQDSFTVQIRDDQGNLRSFAKNELTESTPVKALMPSYRGKLDAQELADLIAYVTAQRGGR